jgi:exodeoxyribonuclease V alpha subunit
MTYLETQLRVTSVRSRGAGGGAIFAGKSDAGDHYVVVADYGLLKDSGLIERAQLWLVAGEVRVVSYTREGVSRNETQIQATQLALQRPSGKNLVAWIAQSPECEGIGEVRARRLWERFGVELPDLLEAEEVVTLAEVVGLEPATSLVSAFAKHGIARTLVWLDQLGLPKPLAASVARYWGKDAQAKVTANPYALVAFCADWKTVDALAQKQFGLAPVDERRLVAATEEALYRAMDDGSTALARSALLTRLRALLGSSAKAEQALAAAVAASVVIEADDLVQVRGLAHIEGTVAERLLTILEGCSLDQEELFDVELPAVNDVRPSIARFEAQHGIELTPEQRDAVVTSATNHVSLILGGAGTGKTTVLKALCHVLDEVAAGSEVHQVALAGRAAQRMAQATGRQSKTIAAFLQADAIAPEATVLVDEVSMVDAILMYRLLRHLPSSVRLVLIGDPSQLPPIGPGLVLHALVGLASIPQTVLKTVKRQAASSGIPQVAQAVREHRRPQWAPYAGKGTGVSVVACDEHALDETVATLYEELGGSGRDFNVQVLSTTRAGTGGVRSLNAVLHDRFAAKLEPVCSWSNEFGVIYERTADQLSLFVDDLVIFTTNDYTLGLRNGALGRVVSALEPATPDDVVCVAEFEGVRYELTSVHLRHITHAFAVTTHKAQGSQFERVIIPVRQSRLLDNSLLYTAITRAVDQVVLVGDICAAERAILAPSSSSLRTTRLHWLMTAVAVARHPPKQIEPLHAAM